MTFTKEYIMIDIYFLIKKGASKNSIKIWFPESNTRSSIYGLIVEKYSGYYDDTFPRLINIFSNYSNGNSVPSTGFTGMIGVPSPQDTLTYQGDPWALRFYHSHAHAEIPLQNPSSYNNYIYGQIMVPHKVR